MVAGPVSSECARLAAARLPVLARARAASLVDRVAILAARPARRPAASLVPATMLGKVWPSAGTRVPAPRSRAASAAATMLGKVWPSAGRRSPARRGAAWPAGARFAAARSAVTTGVGPLSLALAVAAGAVAAAYIVRARRSRWDLRERVVLVTGGSRGLGLLIARQLVDEGARVAICGRDDDTLARARQDLERRGGSVFAARCDVGVRTDVERMVQQVTERLGPIDALINNAGTIAVGPVETMGIEDFHRAMDINFWGAVHAILAVVPGMRRRGHGRIVNVASIGGKISVPHLVPYSASKFALVGLSQGLRAELADDGIQVTTVCPGLMRTGSPRHALFKGRHREEFAWFSVSDSLPLVSMSAERAARQIVRALRTGRSVRILSLPAQVAARVNGLFPGLTSAVLEAVNRQLPDAEGGIDRAVKGEASESSLAPSVLTRLGDRAAARNNQMG
jgi:NAD(P)-dependent dehydrogenase (short-subunit alcohol dehydrogenase family)